MASESLVLVVNPGSASRKYALYADGNKKAVINFEFENGRVISKLEYNDQKFPNTHSDSDLGAVSQYILPILFQHHVIEESDKIHAIGIRVVAPSKQFMQDLFVDANVEAALEAVQQKAPLHVRTALTEIRQLKTYFPITPIIIISDSEFHSTKPVWAWYYGFDLDLAEKLDIKRYGYHGISIGSIVRNLMQANQLAPKSIICHIGSGSSITAVLNGKSVETTMGYTPLEGLMMSTRCGAIDPSAVMGIKHGLLLEDNELEEYLNKKCGLLGVSGSSDDIRQLLTREQQGDERAGLALKMFVYHIQQAIGQMAASMGGVDQLVFSATVGERSAPIRARILDNLSYLGLTCNSQVNDTVFEPKTAVNIAVSNGKPVIVISTDEASEIARRVTEYMNINQK